jgi:hypothetical protein
MTDTPRGRSRDARSAARRHGNASGISGWVGWVVFGGIILLVVGTFQVIQGLVALFRSGYYLVAPSGLAVTVDYSTWGWVHIVLGVLIFATGLGLLSGRSAARVAGVVLAALSAVVNLGFAAAYPVWAVIVIALDVVVIYAIVVHGHELQK